MRKKYRDLALEYSAGTAAQQEQFRKQFASTFGAAPGAAMFEEQVRKNTAMFERAMQMFPGFGYARAEPTAETRAEQTASPEPAASAPDALDEMRRQMDEMRRQIDKLASAKPK